MRTLDRRSFLSRAGVAGAVAVASPLVTFAQKAALAGAKPWTEGFGELVSMGDLALPRGFNYRVLSREGEPMSDGNPTPSFFDGMAAFGAPRGRTVLVRNHENRDPAGSTTQIPVVVPADKLYDPGFIGGNTKLVLAGGRRREAEFAVLGGTTTNCAGGKMPWGSWITCEEVFLDGDQPHGYIYEVPASTVGPVDPVPVKQAGRFVHEAVAWFNGALYETEDVRDGSALFRYIPDEEPTQHGQLAASSGRLQALMVTDQPNAVMDSWPVMEPTDIEWVDIDEPDGTVAASVEAFSKGAAVFDREEGIWVGDRKIYFDCTEGGAGDWGQIWELDPFFGSLKLIYESPGPEELEGPDNLVFTPFGDILLCEDADSPQFLRGLTVEGEIYDFAETITNESEFCGACFDPSGEILYVNQQSPGVTYAIWGPWTTRAQARR